MSAAAVLLPLKNAEHAGTTVYFVKGATCAWHVLAEHVRVLVIGGGRTWTVPFTADDKALLTAIFEHAVDAAGAAGAVDGKDDEDFVLAVEEEKRVTYTMLTMPPGVPAFLADHTYTGVEVTPGAPAITVETAYEEGRYKPEISRRRDGSAKVYMRTGTPHENVSADDFAVFLATLKAAKAAWTAAGKPGGVTKKRMRV